MRISDWSSDVCSSDLNGSGGSMTAQSAAERGAHADTPASLTIAAWREIAGRIWVNSGRHNINLMAAGVAFYAFLSFVPLLGALIMTFGLFADPALVAHNLQVIIDLVPPRWARFIF